MSPHQLSWRDALPSVLAGLLFIGQMVYGFFVSTASQQEVLAWIGIAVFVCSGFFGMAPVVIFPKKGGVDKGNSFVHTTQLVTTGLYAVIRHPQYSTFFYWNVGAMLLFQDWVVVLLGIAAMILTYGDMMREDERNIKKFGKNYTTYMKQVPRANWVVGLIRLWRRSQNS